MIFGVDLSNWQPNMSMTAIAVEGGLRFVICKVSEGASYRSPEWSAQRDGAQAAGLALAGYHYVTPEDPVAQADNCLQALGDHAIPLVLDFEARSGTDIAVLRGVLTELRGRGVRVVLTYLPRWYWRQIGAPDVSDLPPLWSARYVKGDVKPIPELWAGVTEDYWDGYGGNHVAMVQFSASGLVQGRAVDADAFRGTREDLDTLFAGDTPAPAGQWVLSDAEVARIAGAVWDMFSVRLRRGR